MNLSLILLCTLLLQDGTKTPLPDQIRERVNLVTVWGEQVSTPGARAEMRERSRSQKDTSVLVKYELYVTGVPQDMLYSLSYFPINAAKPETILNDTSIASDGLLCPGSDLKHCGQLKFEVLGAPGEPHRYLLVSKGSKFRIAFSVIPNPIIAMDQGCKVEIIRVTPKFEVALIRGAGFKPAEKIIYNSNSAGESVEGSVLADANGTFNFVLLPSVKASDAGLDRVAFKAAACSPIAFYHWGTIN